MTIQMLQAFFMWCSIINVGMLMIMFFISVAAKDWAYKMHSRWFNISKEHFDLVLYCFLGFYKCLVFVFCITPWIVLTIMG
ncbi:MAG: hypothetical protein ISR85_01985 [Kiritimatiellales bacterium]|nr:hypothetical protein [Kiritimatiellota bacterium]MBL7011684.1 hypothetical protein [Kiritimatiellales bacterium]